jgi:2-C-methyl-D-erythritol 2,4-cyclodiphosphate synthase
MRVNLASDLNTDINNISVKATTEEGLGVSGGEQGMSAYAVVLLEPTSNYI